MNEADKTFEKLDYVSMFINVTLGIPRLFFAIRTDKSMEAKFGNGTSTKPPIKYGRILHIDNNRPLNSPNQQTAHRRGT